jgi:hypothetical protein
VLRFRARAFRISNLASGRGGPRYTLLRRAGGRQPSGLKTGLPAPNPTERGRKAGLGQREALGAAAGGRGAGPEAIHRLLATSEVVDMCFLGPALRAFKTWT